MPKRKNNPDKQKDTQTLIVSDSLLTHKETGSGSGRAPTVLPVDQRVSDDLRKKFTNTAKSLTDKRREYLKNLYRDDNFYGFDKVPEFLQLWGRLFQAVVSQAGTKMLTGKYHTEECGIYKYEGGCKIYRVGELVLGKNYCYWNHGSCSEHDDKLVKLNNLITDLVLCWDPCDPINSLLATGAKHAGDQNFKMAIDNSSAGGVFGGDFLHDFFAVSGFGREEDPELDEYHRFVKIHIKREPVEKVDQFFADKLLGKKLHDQLIEKVRKSGSSREYIYSCSPRRSHDGKLQFWINTGRNTQLDGWRTQAEIEKFLNGDGKLHQRR